MSAARATAKADERVLEQKPLSVPPSHQEPFGSRPRPWDRQPSSWASSAGVGMLLALDWGGVGYELPWGRSATLVVRVNNNSNNRSGVYRKF